MTVYCLIDDLYRQYAGPVRAHLPGRPGELSDSEVLTLAVLAQWQPSGSERQFLGWAAKHWRSYFPRLVSQSAFSLDGGNTYANPQPVTPQNAPVVVGGPFNLEMLSGPRFVGSVDEVAVWSVARGAADFCKDAQGTVSDGGCALTTP